MQYWEIELEADEVIDQEFLPAGSVGTQGWLPWGEQQQAGAEGRQSVTIQTFQEGQRRRQQGGPGWSPAKDQAKWLRAFH